MFRKNIFSKKHFMKIIIMLYFLIVGFIPFMKNLSDYICNNPKLMLKIINLPIIKYLPMLMGKEHFASFIMAILFLFYALILIIFFKSDFKKIKISVNPYFILIIILLYFLFKYIDWAIYQVNVRGIQNNANINTFDIFFDPILTGFKEELTYRFLLIDFLLFIFNENKITLILSIILSSIIFSGIHMFHFFPLYMGLLFALLYVSTNNILFPIIFHILNNLIAGFVQNHYFPKFFVKIPLILGALSQILHRLLMILLIIVLLVKFYKNFIKYKKKINP